MRRLTYDVVMADGGHVTWQRLTHGMLYRKLGKSDLLVSEVCLGCMTWGEQTTEEQAHQQLDLAFDEYNVNFVVRPVGCRLPKRRRRVQMVEGGGWM